MAVMTAQKGVLKNSRWGWELKTVRTWRVCAYRLEFKNPSSQFGRADLESGPESGILLLKSLLVDGESEEGHRALQVSRWQQESENGSSRESVKKKDGAGRRALR